MTRDQAKELLERYINGQCTASEKKMVDSWLNDRVGQYDSFWKSEEELELTKKRIKCLLLSQVSYPKRRVANRHIFLFFFPILFAVLITSIYLFKEDEYQRLDVTNYVVHDAEVEPKSVTLTLSNGTIIDLSNSKNDSLHYTDLLSDTKFVNDSRSLAKIDTNVLSVPIGGRYKLILPDGSKVWLNAASQLRFPTQFIGNQRYVQLEGEAYFEIAKNVKQPFLVDAGGLITRVTGTSFNVSSYKEEVKKSVTLIEGEVYVSRKSLGPSRSSEIRLTPGEKAVTNQGNTITIEKADEDAVLAWRSGYFVFDDQEIETVLRDIARWYDVEIFVHKSSTPKKQIGGAFSRNRDVIELLEYLKKLNVLTFTKDGRRLNVVL